MTTIFKIDLRLLATMAVGLSFGMDRVSLFDSNGTARARFSVMDDGHPEITLLSESGKTLVRLAENEGAVQLHMENGGGLGRIILGQTESQFGVDVSNDTGESGVRLRSQPDQSQLSVVGPSGSGIVQIFAQTNKSGMSISNDHGQPGAILTILENQRPMLLLQGQEKRTLVVPQENVAVRPINATGNKVPIAK